MANSKPGDPPRKRPAAAAGKGRAKREPPAASTARKRRPLSGERESLSRRTSKIVEDAALILEEELAAGIGAVRNVEQRLFGDPQTAQDPEAVIHRFRTDAHQIIDLALDVVGNTLSAVGTVAERTIRVGGDVARVGGQGGAVADGRPGGDSVSTLTMPGSLTAGETAEIAMQVENDSAEATDVFELKASDLLSEEGGRIPARNVTFEPRRVNIPAHDAERITVKLRVPAGVKPGTYSGLLQATKLQPVRAVLVVTVA
jgi:hypothetical protein